MGDKPGANLESRQNDPGRMGREEQLVPGTERTLGNVPIYNWMEEDQHMVEAEKRYQKNA